MYGAWRKIAVVGGVAVLAAACASTGGNVPTQGGAYKVGQPYQVDGVWYYPKEQPAYDETGIASWYGADFHGKLTADGEVFDRNAVTGAHPTLPLPVNVRVTNLENGRSIVVRVNDRGPFRNGRVIDLSERAAELLGYRDKGLARVRVTFLGRADGSNGTIVPPEEAPPAIAALPVGPVREASLAPVDGVPSAPPRAVASMPVAAPQADPVADPVAADGSVTRVQVPPATSLFIQAGAFSSRDNAARVVAQLKALGAAISAVMKDGRTIYRVRLGPYADVGEADTALARVQSLGHNDAEIVVD